MTLYMTLNIAGAGDIDLQQANVKDINVSIAGAGDINIANVDSGCQKTILSVAGSGTIKKDEFKITGESEVGTFINK